MAPLIGDSGGSGTRKSMNPFSRPALPRLTPVDTNTYDSAGDGEKKDKKKMGKRVSMFGFGSSTSDLNDDGMSPVRSNDSANLSRNRPRTLQKGKPSSLLGSLGRRSTNNNDGEMEGLSSGTPDSPMEAVIPGVDGFGKAVLYHGEVQTTSGMFRKKKEYLVLTDTHLVRFKSQSRASETFPSIPGVGARSSSTRHPSTTSIGSLQDIQSMHSHTSSEHENRISLSQIVSVYKVEDGRPFFTTEVVYLDEEHYGVGSIQLMLHDPNEADLWHTSIRGAAQKARLLQDEPFPDRVIEYLVSLLEVVDDYDSSHFQVFRVVRRASAGKKLSADDLQKLGSSVFYMVIGINRVHMIPVPDYTDPTGTLACPKTSRNSYGIVSLVDMRVSYEDDRFETAFRTPLQPADVLELAASATPDIAVAILRSWQHLKPLWDHSFNFRGPRRLVEICDAVVLLDEDLGCFDRTLVAYCMAYNCNPMNIQYSIDDFAEDAPEFSLWRPRYAKRYSMSELLAVMRALRFNETFRSISFANIDLHCLHSTIEPYGNDHVAFTTRSGIDIQKYFNITPHLKSVLYQEIQAIALKSTKLRRMDFSNTLPRRRPRDTFDTEGREVDKDPGCEIIAALMPLCQGELTNVTWLNISGVELGETDLDSLLPALQKSKANMRTIELSHCGLNDRGIMQVVSHLERQNATLEYINLSDNPGRINLQQFPGSMSRFSNLRRLNLSRTAWTSGNDALFLPEVMLTWKLEELILNGVPVNENTLDSISTYLASPMSTQLQLLQMDQCNMTGEHVALLMHSMTRYPGEIRPIALHVSANRLEKGVSTIVAAIEANHAPTHLYLRMIEFSKEDHFRQLLLALRTNTTIRCLDISKASLPYDANSETCEAMRAVFAENNTLEELDISGEQAHLEVTRFGIGLNHALTGLKTNSTLKVLRIEYQNLGLEGANTLSSVIEENQGLTQIFCEHNDINLQGFTTLVNAVAKNYRLLELPFMQDDQNTSMKRMNAQVRDTRRSALAAAKQDSNVKSSMQRHLKGAFGGGGGNKVEKKQDITIQDVDQVVKVLNEKWEEEVRRLAMVLERNRNLAMGIPLHDGSANEEEIQRDMLRPNTALSDQAVLDLVQSNTTPKVELGNPVDILAVSTPKQTMKESDKNGNYAIGGTGGGFSGGFSGMRRLESIPSLPELDFPIRSSHHELEIDNEKFPNFRFEMERQEAGVLLME